MAAAVVSPSTSTSASALRLTAHLRNLPLDFASSELHDEQSIVRLLEELQPELARRVNELATDFLREASQMSSPIALPVQFQGLPLSSYPAGLRHPLSGILTFEDCGFVLEVPDLGIVVDSQSREGIVEALGEQVDALAVHYLSMEDSQLTPGGKAVKDLLRALVVG